MPIHRLVPPAGSTDVLIATLNSASTPGGPALRASYGANAGQADLPHPVYELSLIDLASGNGVSAARLIAWRYLLPSPTGGKMVAAEVHVDPGGAHEFGSLNEGPFVADTIQATTRAEGDATFANGSYELRLLRIPALFVVALWLKDQAGVGDRFIPIGTVFPPLTAGRTYLTHDLEQLLAGPAADRLKVDDQPKP
jgi:hypothetical protein